MSRDPNRLNPCDTLCPCLCHDTNGGVRENHANGYCDGKVHTNTAEQLARYKPGFPCPHGCKDHTVASDSPTACGHYHSPTEWGHHEQQHNSDYWKAIGEQANEPGLPMP